MKNKPEWLIKAEEEQAKYNETKWAKMPESKIQGALVLSEFTDDIEHQKKAFAKVLENNPDHQSYAGKIGGTIGGVNAAANEREKYGEEYNAVMKSRLYDNLKNKEEFHKKGQAAAVANQAKKRNAILAPYYDKIPKDVWITAKELDNVFEGCEILDAGFKFRKYFPHLVKHNGIRGIHSKYMFETKLDPLL